VNTKPPEEPPKPPMDDEEEEDDQIKDTMTEQEIREAGLIIDLPFESGSADPQSLEYEDFLPEERKFKGKMVMPTDEPEDEEA
jgi:hypothetical protein